MCNLRNSNRYWQNKCSCKTSVHSLDSGKICQEPICLYTCLSRIWQSDNWRSLPANQPSFQFPDGRSTSCLCCSWWGPVCQVVSTAWSLWRCSLFHSMEELSRWEHPLAGPLANLVSVWLRLRGSWNYCNLGMYSSKLASSLLHQFPCHSMPWTRFPGTRRLGQSNKHPKEKKEIFCGGSGTRGQLTIELYLKKIYSINDGITLFTIYTPCNQVFPELCLTPAADLTKCSELDARTIKLVKYTRSLRATSHHFTSHPIASFHITSHHIT